MGSSSSKHNVDEPSTSSSAGRRKIRSIVLSPSCLRFDDTDDAVQVADYQSKGNCPNDSSNSQIIVNEDHTKDEYFGKSKSDKSLELARKASSNDINEWGEFNISDTASRVGSSSQTLSPSNSFLSRCSFFRGKFGNSSFRLSRAPCTRLLSANSAPSSRNFSASDEENHNNTEKDHIHGSVHSQDDQIISTVNMLSDGNNHMEQRNVNLQAPENFIEMENMESRHTDRRNGVERNVRFSRTLSVGRLRDRVLRRSSFPEVTFSPLQQDREVRETGEGVLAHNGSDLALSNSFFHSTGMDSSSYNGENYDVEPSRARDGRYRDLLEHRSNFLERRGRIRSQVRALQRLGSRFENLSGHERSCIISGQHRTGQCTCHITTRSSGPNDDTGARQSISRIVMLAEALFEVLDEIHQQSVVLSSRPSVSSIGSIPAPSDVVESLPVKLYSKLQQHVIEEAAQCYICLVEYEEGDTVRTLPCHHEFHRTCVDKWLKEVHRVCPLCRGDICTPELMAFEN